jgi:hypothetical protein
MASSVTEPKNSEGGVSRTRGDEREEESLSRGAVVQLSDSSTDSLR